MSKWLKLNDCYYVKNIPFYINYFSDFTDFSVSESSLFLSLSMTLSSDAQSNSFFISSSRCILILDESSPLSEASFLSSFPTS